MNASRIIGAGLFGGIVMFIWGALSHMVLPVGDMGMKGLPGEEMIMPAMKFSIQERGFYMFPGMKEGELTDEDMEAWTAKYKQGPRGIVVFDPSGGDAMAASQLGAEFGSNVLAAFFAAVILSRVTGPRSTKTLLAMLIGVVGWLSINASYWTWYRFPNLFTVGQLIEQGVGWFLSGAAIALVLGGHPKPRPAGMQM